MSTDLTERWAEVWSKTIARVEESTGVPCDEWRTGGRRSKALPEGESLAFWQSEGLQQVEKYLEWYKNSGWSIHTMPDGKPGIEWEAEVWFGPSKVRLVVDAIYRTGVPWMDAIPDELIVVDYKTGSRPPAGPVQLALYASAIEKVYGVRPRWGAYYMSRKGVIDDLIDLTPWGIDYFEYEFGAMQAFMDTGFYPPNVGEHCSYCSFRDYCVAANGSKSSNYPLQITTKENNT